MIRSLLEEAGTSVEQCGSLLDWGCGCGRVLRHWSGLGDTAAYGCDINPKMVAWCNENLPFAHVTVNELSPPLPYDDSSFGLVYAFSVLTHLPVDLQHAWVAELTRILRPSGYLLLSTHGERYLERLTSAERELFRAGEVVVRFEEVAGTNLCTTFHPPAYVRDELGAALELVDEVPEGAKGNPHQDLFLFRKS